MMNQEQQIKCYGQTIESLQAEKSELKVGSTFNSTEMYVMSILSDAQHVLAMGNAEYSRQLMNKAKWFLNQQDTANREERVAKTGSPY